MDSAFLSRRLTAVVFLGLGLSACSDLQPPPEAGRNGAPSASSAMMARGSFFSGTIGVEILLGAGVGFGRSAGGGDDDESSLSPVFFGGGRDALSPVQLHLRLANTGKEVVQVEILDFNSALGNFSVRPSKVVLAAGESREVEPMISRFGVTADAIPLFVRLRVDDRVDQRALELQLVRTPPGPR